MLIASFLSLTAYLIYAVRVCGVPASVSDTYYILLRKRRPAWLFQLAMILTGGLLLPAWLEASPENLQFLAFLACGALIFVGAAPSFKVGHERVIHIAATVVSGLSTLAWEVASGYWIVPAIMLAVAVPYGVYKRRVLFFVELAAFASAYICVYLNSNVYVVN